MINKYIKKIVESQQGNNDFQKTMEKRKAAQVEKLKYYANEQAPILKELKDIGYDVDHLAYFMHTKEKYKDVIPILKKHLDKDYSEGTRETIIRSLAANWYKDHEIIEKLFELFEQEEDFNLRWAIGNTLSVIVKDKRYADRALSLLKSKKYGQSADRLVACYARVYKDQAVPELIEFIKDEDLRNEAIDALGRLKSKESRSYIEECLKNEDSWVRNKAKAAIKKIDNAK